jgi:hypothetical protein
MTNEEDGLGATERLLAAETALRGGKGGASGGDGPGMLVSAVSIVLTA